MKKARIAIAFLAAVAAFLGNGILAALTDEDPIRKIVVFRQEIDDGAKDELAAKHRGIKIKKLGIINGQAMMISEKNARELEKQPGVLRVDDDIIVTVFNNDLVKATVESEVVASAQLLPWGIERIRANDVWPTGNTGAGIKVGIIDTGISDSHPDLTGNVKGGVNTIVSGGSWNDDNGHGSHVAGIVAALDNAEGVVGAGPRIDLYAIKTMNSAGDGYLSDIVEGLNWAVVNKMQVVNMSLGTTSNVQSFRDAVARAKNAGVVVIAAAGNSSNSSTCTAVRYPAAYPEVIAVSAIDSNGAIPYWSCRGEQVDLAAPGASIYSTYKGIGYATLSGTSMAAPHVAAAAALVLKNDSGLTPDQIKTRLQNAAQDLGAAGFDNLYGWGLVNVFAAVDDSLPGISLVAPPNNAVYDSAQTVAIIADANDNVGVSKVEFYDGATLLGTDSNSPYTYDWVIGAADNGSHLLTAMAYDIVGNSAVSGSVAAMVNIASGDSDFWLDNYIYRKPVVVANFNGALFGQQVQANINTAELIANAKMKSDCGDMRLTTADGATQLSYWIESGCNTADTVVWVKIPVMPAGDTVIYLYYGNVAAVSASNGDATFRFFDDFNDTSINPGKWVTGNSSYARVVEANGYVRLSADKYNAKLYASLSSAQKYAYPMKLVYSFRSQANNIHGFAGTGAVQFCSYESCDMAAYESQRNNTAYGNPAFTVGSTAVNTKTTVANIWSRNIMNLKSGSSSLSIGQTAYPNGAAFPGTADYLKFNVRKWFSAYNAVYDYDYVALVNYAVAEPSVSLGAEMQSEIPDADTGAPAVSLATPANNMTYIGAQTVAIIATASDNIGVSKVEFYDGATLLATDTSAPYSYNWSITAANNGTHSLTAKAYDAAGNNTTSGVINVTVNIPVADPDAFVYRKQIDISNPGSLLTDHQIQVNLDTAGMVAAGKLQADCDDLRFTDGANQLSYWIESGCNTADTVVWVKIPSLPQGESVIYLDYGNPAATSASSGDATFKFFDDFNDSSLNSSKWVSGKSSNTAITEAGGYLRLYGNTDSAKLYAYTSSQNKISYPAVVETSARLSSGSYSHGFIGMGNLQAATYDSPNHSWFQRLSRADAYKEFNIGQSNAATKTMADNAWTRLTQKISSGASVSTIAGSSFANAGLLNDTDGYLKLNVRKWYGSASAQYDFDWVAVRNYAAAEPTASLGAEVFVH